MTGVTLEQLLYELMRVVGVLFAFFFFAANLIIWRQAVVMQEQISTRTGAILLVFVLLNTLVSGVLFVASLILLFT